MLFAVKIVVRLPGDLHEELVQRFLIHVKQRRAGARYPATCARGFGLTDVEARKDEESASRIT